eukprot:TRINITY_DN83907_c0_g1_i1.p1 TRINITY_DN83907_c0_g1~~TRINITY_DN83907_c0_g1_i1.p1  ORF type:complete len:744 (+),score=210.64 TRINITY_DN83907_c0_g1_i1:187-2418(+)
MKAPSSPRGKPGFEVGQTVQFRNQGKPEEGVVRWIGQLPIAEGEWLGLALGRGIGKNDGTGPDGKRYFECAPRHGVFIRPAAVTALPEAAADSLQPVAPQPAAAKAGGVRATCSGGPAVAAAPSKRKVGTVAAPPTASSPSSDDADASAGPEHGKQPEKTQVLLALDGGSCEEAERVLEEAAEAAAAHFVSQLEDELSTEESMETMQAARMRHEELRQAQVHSPSADSAEQQAKLNLLENQMQAIERKASQQEALEKQMALQVSEGSAKEQALRLEHSVLHVELEAVRSEMRSHSMIREALQNELRQSSAAAKQELQAAAAAQRFVASAHDATEGEMRALMDACRTEKAACTEQLSCAAAIASQEVTSMRAQRDLMETEMEAAKAALSKEAAAAGQAQGELLSQLHTAADSTHQHGISSAAAVTLSKPSLPETVVSGAESNRDGLAELRQEVLEERKRHSKARDSYTKSVKNLQTEIATYERAFEEEAALASQLAEEQHREVEGLVAAARLAATEIECFEQQMEERDEAAAMSRAEARETKSAEAQQQEQEMERLTAELHSQTDAHQAEIVSLSLALKQELEDTQGAHQAITEKHRQAEAYINALRSELQGAMMNVTAARGSQMVADSLALDAGNKVNCLKSSLAQVKTLMKDVKKHKAEQQALREELAVVRDEQQQQSEELRQRSVELEAARWQLECEQQKTAARERRSVVPQQLARPQPGQTGTNSPARASFFGWLGAEET